ncbi:MAG: lysozyme [Cyanobacteria bacterium P01_A01_bin.37]
MRIRTETNTLGKMKPEQSGFLEPSQVIDLDAGEEFEVISEQDNHYVVSIHIFKGHATEVKANPATVPHRGINNAGKELIKRFEGLKLQSYLCPADVWTIGYGSTDGIVQDMKISEGEADNLLEKDLVRFEKAVNTFVEVPLNDNEFSALVSLAFNIGIGAFKRSTLLKLLNKNKRAIAAREFDKWIWGGEKILPGLVARRAAEKDLFLS